MHRPNTPRHTGISGTWQAAERQQAARAGITSQARVRLGIRWLPWLNLRTSIDGYGVVLVMWAEFVGGFCKVGFLCYQGDPNWLGWIVLVGGIIFGLYVLAWVVIAANNS